MIKEGLLLLAGCLLLSQTVIGQIIYVNAAAQGANNGSSWQDAYTSLDAAIENTTIGQLWIVEGTYYPETDLEGNVPSNAKLATFRFKENLALYGGFVGSETALEQRDWESNETILSGDIGILDDLEDNVRHVVSTEFSDIDSNSKLDGLTIRDGYSFSQYSGAGIYVNGAEGSFVIRNCIIENNFSYRDGGGIYVFNGNPLIENNIFRNNKAFSGGAMYLYYSDALVRNNQFLNNITDDYDTVGSTAAYGGGIYVSAYASPIIEFNLFDGNYARERGGAVDFESNYHSTFKNNIVINNESKKGGGLHIGNNRIYFFNNLVAKNIANERGGGIYFDYVFLAEIINNTIAYNSAQFSGGALFVQGAGINLANTIINNNISQDDLQIMINYSVGNFSSFIRFCNIENGISSVGAIGAQNLVYEDNTDALPEFVNITEDNFRLFSTSSSIDAGTYSSSIISAPWTGSNGQVVPFPSLDLDGGARVVSTIDMGAYEYGSLGVNDYNQQQILLYPNPTHQLVFIKEHQRFETASLLDAAGRLLEVLQIANDDGSINLAGYSSGFYFIQLYGKEGTVTKRVILEN